MIPTLKINRDLSHFRELLVLDMMRNSNCSDDNDFFLASPIIKGDSLQICQRVLWSVNYHLSAHNRGLLCQINCPDGHERPGWQTSCLCYQFGDMLFSLTLNIYGQSIILNQHANIKMHQNGYQNLCKFGSMLISLSFVYNEGSFKF